MYPNDPKLRSFIEVDLSSHFPIQNLPYGVFTTPMTPKRRVGVAIGDFVLDLSVLKLERLIQPAPSSTVFSQPTINDFSAPPLIAQSTPSLTKSTGRSLT